MNIELVNSIQDKLAQTATDISEIKKELTRLKLQSATSVKSERKIKPGTGCKITYNESGLVTNSVKLDASDIPALPMSKITGLYEALSNLIPKTEMSNLNNGLTSANVTSVPVKSGTKVNVDRKGLVTDVTDLLASDIPELPISKITGLQSVLDGLMTYRQNGIPEENFQTPSGTACKVTWDTKGRIVNSSTLRIEDLPRALVDRIIALESSTRNMALSTDIERIDSILSAKMDRPQHTAKAGIYTKVVVNADGLITTGSQLTKADIPQLTIEDIPKLSQQLASKANTSDIDNINEKISQLGYQIRSQSRNIPILGSTNQEELSSIKEQIAQLQLQASQVPVLPDLTQIIAEINNIKNELTTLSGRIAVLENNIK